MQTEEVVRGPLPIKSIEPYHKIALREAELSPCVRRKFGVVIAYDDYTIMVRGNNARVTKCCNDTCIRDRAGVVNGSRTELGAEVHAEQAALIEAPKKGIAFVLAGYDYSHPTIYELRGQNVYPCLVCARMIKYAGYKYVYMKGINGDIAPVSIHEIIEYRELELGPVYE